MDLRKALSVAGLICSIALCLSIGCQATVETGPALTGAGEAPPPAPMPTIQAPYAAELQPLSTEECGRCHLSIYNLIRNEGTKHQIDCTRCHKQYHIYRPEKVSYEDILPQCETCHGQPHGAAFAECFDCHVDAHAPTKIPSPSSMEEECSTCHPKVGKEITAHMSAHTDLDCSSCHHSKHGYIPECMECHDPHTGKMTQADCLACHPPHRPMHIICPDLTSQETCAACHDEAYDLLKVSGTKHTALLCTKCHPGEHKSILQCEDCHGKPHGEAIMKKFETCGGCHGVAHDLLPTGSAK